MSMSMRMLVSDPTGNVKGTGIVASLSPEECFQLRLAPRLSNPFDVPLYTRTTKKKAQHVLSIFLGDPAGNRTPIARMKTWCPNR